MPPTDQSLLKSTDTNQLLHRTSFHPRHTFKGIVKSQFIRFKRISSTIYDYQEAAATLIHVLRNRGYNHSFLRRIKRQIWRHYDVSLNRKKPENEEEDKQIIPVITHYDGFHSRLNRRWAQLIRATSVFNDTRVILAYRRHKNLRDHLVKGYFGEPVEPEDPEAMLASLLYVIDRDG